MIPDFLEAARSAARQLRLQSESQAGPLEADSIDVESVIHRGLDWAFESLGDAAALHEAHGILEATLADYYAAIRHAMKSGRPDLEKSFESHRRAAAEFHRGWPATSAAEEESRVTEMAGGKHLGLDELFLGISGLSREEWEKAVSSRRSVLGKQEQPAHG
jgi:hypothetical protein